MAYKEFITCKCCGYIFREGCFSCKHVVICNENSMPIKIKCPKCGSCEKQDREKRKYFICPNCFEPVIEESELKNPTYDLSGHNYCTNCGHKLSSILQEARQILNNTDAERKYGGGAPKPTYTIPCPSKPEKK